MARRPPAPQEPDTGPKVDLRALASRPLRIAYWLLRPFLKFAAIAFIIVTAIVALFKWVNPPVTYLMYSEYQRLGAIAYSWRDIEDMSPNIPLAFVAAEDANFCAHDGFDFDAIETAIEEGRGRGASTISQQVAKNVFLWPGRSWLRKGLEAGLTVMIENLWTKRRILEVYLNVVELQEGVFGVDAAIALNFVSSPENLRLQDAARMAAVLPNPKERSISSPSATMQRRASQVAIGATTLKAEGRDSCFAPPASP